MHTLDVAREHGFSFDTVADAAQRHGRATTEASRSSCFRSSSKIESGVLGMKSMGNGIILKSRKVTAVECLRYALNLPTSVVITGCDTHEDPGAGRFEGWRALSARMSAAQVKTLLAKTKASAKHGEFELFKTTSAFDSTATNPDWLGEESQHVQRMMPA